MSDRTPQPSTEVSSSAAADRSGLRRRRRIALVRAAVVAMLLAAATVTTVILVSDRNGQPQNRYMVSVFLEDDITAEQKAAVEAALPALNPVDGVRFVSREEAWKKAQAYQDDLDLIASAKAEQVPESFLLQTTGEVFDCAALAPVRQMSGVDEIQVVQRPAEGRPGAVVACG